MNTNFDNMVFRANIFNARDAIDLSSQIEEFVNRTTEKGDLIFNGYNIIKKKSIRNENIELVKYDIIFSFKKASH